MAIWIVLKAFQTYDCDEMRTCICLGGRQQANTSVLVNKLWNMSHVALAFYRGRTLHAHATRVPMMTFQCFTGIDILEAFGRLECFEVCEGNATCRVQE